MDHFLKHYKDHNDIANHCFTKDINMASNGYQYECRQKHRHTLTLARTHTHAQNKHTHLVTVNRCQGHCGGSQVLARYHIKNNTDFTHC